MTDTTVSLPPLEVHCAGCGFTSPALSLISCPRCGSVLGERAAVRLFADLTARELTVLRSALTTGHGTVFEAGYQGDLTAAQANGLTDDLNDALCAVTAESDARALASV